MDAIIEEEIVRDGESETIQSIDIVGETAGLPHDLQQPLLSACAAPFGQAGCANSQC